MAKIFFDSKKWFLETPFPGVRRAKRDLFFLQKEILRKKTKFQNVLIFETPGFGKVLALDGIIQLSELDEAIYHETMAHTTLLSHPKPQSVLIVGGGDGGVLREVLKHKTVKKAHMVEIDQEIPQICQKYLGFISQGAFKNPRAKLFIEDGSLFIKRNPASYDVIMVDSTDPVGPGKALFEYPFYKQVNRALKNNGIAIFQAGPFLDLKGVLVESLKSLKRLFKYVCLIRLPMPSYSCGCEYCFILASKKYDPEKISFKILQQRLKLRISKPEKLRYYNPSIHLASLAIPAIWQK